jgi:uncharacterized protein (TIGR03086 family)
MTTLDLRPATNQVGALLGTVRDDDLAAPTPCTGYSLGALLDHFMALTNAFAVAARKGDLSQLAGESPAGKAAAEHLDPRWREVLPTRLDDLAAAWNEPGAWEGETIAAGPVMPARTAGLFALDEVVLHGWDLARATGQDYGVDPTHLAALGPFVEMTAQPDQAGLRSGMFGPVVDVASAATSWDRTLGLAGRDPRWTPAS